MEGSFTTLIQLNVERMRRGDKLAGDELFRVVSKRLQHLAKRMIQNYPVVQRWSDADDVVQNASLRLWRALEATRPASTREFFNLAAVQIRRELIDLARRFRGPLGMDRHHESFPDVAALPSIQSKTDSDELDRWSALHVQAADLPEPEREVFDLIFYHGCQQQEAAEICEVDVRTVRRRWHSALLKLKTVVYEWPDA